MDHDGEQNNQEDPNQQPNQEQEIQQQEEEQFDFQQMPQILDPFSYLANQIHSIDNQVLLQRGPLESLTNLLQVSSPSIFDDVHDAQTCVLVIQAQYHKKKSDLESTVYHIMKGYDEMNLKVNLNQLEKIMRILKSKQKSIYISKDVTCCCHCSHHQTEEISEQTQEQEELNSEAQHHQENIHSEQHQHIHETQCEDLIVQYQEQQQQKQDEQDEQQQQKQEEQLQQQFEQKQFELKQQEEQIVIIEQADQTLLHNLQSKEEEKQLLQVEIQIEQKQPIKDTEQKLEQGEQIKSEEQIKQINCEDKQNNCEDTQQIDENQVELLDDLQSEKEKLDQLRQMQEQMQQEGQIFQNDLEQNVEELKESIQQSRLQIEKLTEQRNQLLLKSRELAEKQLELRVQQAQLIEQLDGQKQEEEKKNISCSDIFGIMSLHNLNLSQLQNYDTSTNSLVFTLHNNYRVEIKGDEADLPRQLNQDSPLIKVPSFIVHSHILPYLGAFELFKAREVCGWFKEQVKSCWPSVFKREMFEQLLAKDLKKNIFNLDKMHLLKTTLYMRIRQLIEAMMQVLDWDTLQEQINTKTVEIGPLKIVVALLTLMKKQNRIQYLQQVDEEESFAEEAKDFKESIKEYLQNEFGPLSMTELRQVDVIMISNSDFQLEYQGNSENKTGLYLCILMNLLYFFSIIKLNLTCESYQLLKMRTEADILGQRQIYNQNFLEGAYKKLLLRNYVDDQDDGEIDASNEVAEAQQFLKALTNLMPTENPDPDIVIRRNKTVTKIYIDVNTKLDILVSTIEQYKGQKPAVDETQKVCYDLINEIIEVIVQTDQKEQQIQE